MKRLILAALVLVGLGAGATSAQAQQPGTWGNHWRVGPTSYSYYNDAVSSYYTRTTPTVQTWGHDLYGRTYNNVTPGFTYGHHNGVPFGGYTPFYGGSAYGYTPPPGGWGPSPGWGAPAMPVGGYGSGYAPSYGAPSIGGGPRMVCIPAY